ncbi:MAG: glutamine--fructose-6-phosphate transaminase (isomerizing) [Acidobacteriota bacterium]|nr:MAG: glutamine--fructose-6-phosphate transaminase (isomerizing) [Acidobacteriota bacterium]
MCGIVGYVGGRDAVPLLIESLKRLEYRGYDSAGLAVIEQNGALALRRNAGKIHDLEAVVRKEPLRGLVGLGHTRWATHGRPTEENAHPHRDCKGEVVVIQNGIIENYAALKDALSREKHAFVTETDTEVVAHLIEKHLPASATLAEAVRKAASELEGLYAITVISTREPGLVVALKQGPPLIVGLGEEENYVASDVQALLPYTRDVVYLEDGDLAEVRRDSVRVVGGDGTVREPVRARIPWDPVSAEKGGFKHFMLKEIHEQPTGVRETLLGRINLETGAVHLEEINLDDDALRRFERVHFVACGTSWHACLVGKRYVEHLARLACEVDYGSEYRYRDPIADERTLTVAVSQSGETADTLAAMEESSSKGSTVLSICNVRGSMITRKSHGVLYTHAGPEIGVASTKAFTSQLAALHLLALRLGQARGVLSVDESREAVTDLACLPHAMENYLANQEAMAALEEAARAHHTYRNFLYLGRGIHYPLALEGALKLKEISYIHAEGYPGGEMKHGPIALIDEQMPVVALVFGGATRAKIMGNIEEVKARGGNVIALTCEGDSEAARKADTHLSVPRVAPLLVPVLEALPLQLFAYHIASLLGCDVDQPRNLAKSVTVE